MASASKLITQAARAGRGVSSFAVGKLNAVLSRSHGPKAGMSDSTLKAKVETELFRDPTVPKGQIDVNVVDATVELRGEVRRAEMKKALAIKAAAIPEVRMVKNLLHLPKTPAPTRADSLGRARRKASTGSGAGPRRSERVNTEKPVEGAEPSPAEIADSGKGRQPPPLGGDAEA